MYRLYQNSIKPFFMGSKQKRYYYNKLHEQYSSKYGISPHEIAGVRALKLTRGAEKEDILKHYISKLNNRLAERKVLDEHIEDVNKMVKFLSNCSNEEFNDLTIWK